MDSHIDPFWRVSAQGGGIRLKTGSVRFLAPFKRHGQQLRRHRSRRNLWAWFGAASTALASLAAYPLIQSSLKPGPSVAVDRVDSSSHSDPTSFSPEELQELQRRFGVHGPQPPLARLFTKGVDQFTPLRNHTVTRLQSLQPVIQQQSRRTGLNPMLLAAILFDEMQHAKPGEDHPLAAHSGLFSTHGPAQLGLSEMEKQGLLRPNASAEEIQEARNQLLDPERNVELLAGKMMRLLKLLERDVSETKNVSRSHQHAKTVATLAYLHNGKLDYPARILRYMQDPELHGLVYGRQRKPVSPLI